MPVAAKCKSFSLLFACLLALLSACSSPKPKTEESRVATKAVKNRKNAPDFTLTDAAGKQVKLSDLRGKVVLLNFWATWCGPCAIEIPWFIEFQQQYRSKGLEIVGVSMDEEGWSAVKPYIRDHKLNYEVLLGNDSVSQLYGGVESLPTTFVIDRDGKLAFPPHVGLIEKSEYNSEIQSLLGEKQTSSQLARGPAFPAILLPGAGK